MMCKYAVVYSGVATAGRRTLSPSTRDDAVDLLPLPPSSHLLQTLDDLDDMPLPPPPPELCVGYDSHSSRRDVVRNSVDCTKHQQGFSAAVRRAASARRASEISRFGFSSSVSATRRSEADGTDDALTSSIKQGVKLKKTVSRDRSAPRLPIQHY